MKQVTALQVLLVLVALVLLVPLLYSFLSSPSSATPNTLQLADGIGIIVVGIAAALLFFLRPPQKRPGEQVSY